MTSDKKQIKSQEISFEYSTQHVYKLTVTHLWQAPFIQITTTSSTQNQMYHVGEQRHGNFFIFF